MTTFQGLCSQKPGEGANGSVCNGGGLWASPDSLQGTQKTPLLIPLSLALSVPPPECYSPGAAGNGTGQKTEAEQGLLSSGSKFQRPVARINGKPFSVTIGNARRGEGKA